MLTVILSHCKNPDINHPCDGYWIPPLDRGVPMKTAVKSLADAAARCRRYIERNQLGGGNWNGGQVYDGEEPIARVSFNGRVWDMNDNEITEMEHAGR